MKNVIAILALVGLGAASFAIPTVTQEHGREEKKEATAKADSDIDKLYELVRQARAELQTPARAGRYPSPSDGEGRVASMAKVVARARGEHGGEGRREGRR